MGSAHRGAGWQRGGGQMIGADDDAGGRTRDQQEGCRRSMIHSCMLWNLWGNHYVVWDACLKWGVEGAEQFEISTGGT